MGQRSQIYVRFNKENGQKGLIANYYGWNFGERMISRARWGIECIKEHFEYISNPSYRWLNVKRNEIYLSRIFDTNFDMCDVAISCNIIKELLDLYNVSIDSKWVKSDLDEALKKENLDETTASEVFKDYIFMNQDNNDGKLFVDIQDDGIKYCFLDSTSNTDNIMDAAAYMVWNHQNCKEPDWTKDEYITPEQKEKCCKNIIAINKMATLMTKEEIEDFINYDYLGDTEQLPLF